MTSDSAAPDHIIGGFNRQLRFVGLKNRK